MAFKIENGVLVSYSGTDTEVVIPNGVTGIAEGAFSECEGVTSITIGKGVTSIDVDDTTFAQVALDSISVADGNSVYEDKDSNVIIKKSTGELIKGCNSSTIPAGVKSIGEYAFYNCTAITSLSLPTSLKTIDAWAFFMSGLTSITIPSSVETLGEAAFGINDSLTTVTVDSQNVVDLLTSKMYDNTGLLEFVQTLKIKSDLVLSDYLSGLSYTTEGNYKVFTTFA